MSGFVGINSLAALCCTPELGIRVGYRWEGAVLSPFGGHKEICQVWYD
ncbi:rCG21072 [Rattus norvegicus]|uniref:RCG21072 n=1 Tax=Rattus norvegicus TaxID=10116 RepID=A6KDM6_RAT|nr:rCG21072 [Rattus norvegicus]